MHPESVTSTNYRKSCDSLAVMPPKSNFNEKKRSLYHFMPKMDTNNNTVLSVNELHITTPVEITPDSINLDVSEIDVSDKTFWDRWLKLLPLLYKKNGTKCFAKSVKEMVRIMH